jgi:predicted DNA-binding transcriptional regulator AlpA
MSSRRTPTTPTPQNAQAGGRTTTTGNGLAVAPGGNAAPAAIVAELLTTAEAAKLLGLGERTLWRNSRCGVCPKPLKIGGGKKSAVRYSRRALLQWVADGCPRTD